MKNKLRLIAVTVLLAFAFVGCSSEAPKELEAETLENNNTLENIDNMAIVQTDEAPTEETITTEKMTLETEADTQEPTVLPEFTFADLSTKRFEFCSGVGGWSEEITIEKDGYFTGNFYDSNIGETGEGYEDGTMYVGSYSGHFTDLTKINDHTYQMKLADISYKETSGSSETIDNVCYNYTDSYYLGGKTETFTIYLPGKPLGEISEEAYLWLDWMNESESELTMIAIVDETTGNAMYSYDRLAPLEDAQGAYRTYKESYDYYGEKLSAANTTLEMVEYSGTMYEISDDCLNYIWNLIRYNVDEDKYQEILAEQREWISEKEAAAEEAGAEFAGGSLSSVSYNDRLAELTIKRCEELIEYLK